MAVTTPRERLIRRLFDMTEEQIKRLDALAETVIDDIEAEEAEETDPTVGLIAGPTDLAARARDILHEDVDLRSGWTQKDPLS
jgi:hypothetical protein